MENNTEGSEQLPDEQIRENLRAHAEALDAGEEPATPIVTKTPESTPKPGEAANEEDGDRAPESEAGKKPDSSETPTEKKPGEEKAGEETPPGEKPTGEQKQPSKYAKAKKDKARLDKSWQALEAEKKAVRAEAQKIAEFQQQRQTQPQEMSQRTRFGSKEYWQAAEEFERAGLKLLKDPEADPGAAEEKFGYAHEARISAQQAYQAEYQEAAQQSYREFENQWVANTQAEVEKEPALQDPESELSVEMEELLHAYPLLGMHPQGFSYGLEVLKMRHAAAEVSELREASKKDKKEIERLNGLLSVSGSHDATKQKSGGVDFNSLPIDEQREHLRRDAEAADAA